MTMKITFTEAELSEMIKDMLEKKGYKTKEFNYKTKSIQKGTHQRDLYTVTSFSELEVNVEIEHTDLTQD